MKTYIYLPNIEINESYAKLMPDNCAVKERTGDGVSVGTCTFYLKGGTICPRHGIVRMEIKHEYQ